MDELHERRRRKALERFPSVDALLEMFETQRSVQFRVTGERELLNEARRRIRGAAKRFGRPVETHYVKQTGMLFGMVPSTVEESRAAQVDVARAMNRLYSSTPSRRAPKSVR